MARNRTLLDILNGTRAEARLSLLPAHNVQSRDGHVALIQREQERLWEDFDWPHLRVERYIPLVAGQRFYEPGAALNEAGGTPEQQIPVERIHRVEVKSDGVWLPMEPQIRPEDYAAHDSVLDERAWPPRRWQLTENDDIEVWPVPDADADPSNLYGYLRISGIRALRPFVDDGDRADLDDKLIEMYTAGAILAASGAKDANLKLEAAGKRYARLKGSNIKSADFSLFGVARPERKGRAMITRYRPPVA